MRLIDAQIHIWEKSRPDRPWPADRQGYTHGPDGVSADEIVAAMDTAGVGGAILIPPSFEGDYNDLVMDAVTRYPDRFRALGRVWLSAPDAPAQLERMTEAWQFLGTRITFAGPMRSWLTDGTLDWFWPFAAERDIRVSAYPFGQLEALEPVLAAFPTLKLSLDHLSIGLDVHDEAMLPIVDHVIRLARYPNLAVKATCLPSHVTEAYPFPLLRKVLRAVIEAYGPERVFWGSDLTRLSCPYTQLIDLFNDVLAEFPKDYAELIMGKAALKWYKWEDVSGPTKV